VASSTSRYRRIARPSSRPRPAPPCASRHRRSSATGDSGSRKLWRLGHARQATGTHPRLRGSPSTTPVVGASQDSSRERSLKPICARVRSPAGRFDPYGTVVLDGRPPSQLRANGVRRALVADHLRSRREDGDPRAEQLIGWSVRTDFDSHLDDDQSPRRPARTRTTTRSRGIVSISGTP